MTQNLSRLLHPKSVTVIGGGAWCRNVILQCKSAGFSGDIWPVHPNLTEIENLTTFPDINALPGAPDACFIGINSQATIRAIRELRTKGAGGAICFASGFSEARAETSEGEDLEKNLLAAAGTMPILGPNCYGLINCLDGVALWPDQHGAIRVETGVAIITQSSNIALNLTMQTRGLPVSYVATVGNQAQIGFAQIAQAFLNDPRVTAIGLHIEGITDIRALEDLAQEAKARGKSIIALKIGKSEQAQSATISHTASLAGSTVGASALFKRLGIGQVHSLSAFLETLKLLHINGALTSNNIASMSCSGGEASLIADTAHGRNVHFPPLNQEQYDALRAALGPKVALANPLDYHTYIWGDQSKMTDTFCAMMKGNLGLGLVVLDFPRVDRCTSDDWSLVINAVKETQGISGIPMAIVASLPETLPEDVAIKLRDLGITPLCGFDDAITAIEIAAQLGKTLPHPAPLFLTAPTGKGVLNEAQSKQALSDFSVCIPKSYQASSAQEAAEKSAQIGFPIVLKGEGFAHKSEAGAVILNLGAPDEVEQAAQKMACVDFLVEEMITDAVCELLVGITYDPAHGYILTLAAGGIMTEILGDSQSLMVPATRDEVHEALMNLKIAPLLKGFRGAPPANVDAVLQTVDSVQKLAMSLCAHEIEINPLLVTPMMAVAADALIRIGDD